jgi:hypothetical protein
VKEWKYRLIGAIKAGFGLRPKLFSITRRNGPANRRVTTARGDQRLITP